MSTEDDVSFHPRWNAKEFFSDWLWVFLGRQNTKKVVQIVSLELYQNSKSERRTRRRRRRRRKRKGKRRNEGKKENLHQRRVFFCNLFLIAVSMLDDSSAALSRSRFFSSLSFFFLLTIQATQTNR